MKRIRILTALLVAVTLTATLLGCSFFSPTTNGGGNATPQKTSAQTHPAREEDFDALNALYAALFRTLTRAQTTVSYDDPAVGTTLTAVATLTTDGTDLTYRATVDRLNDADAERFLSAETLDPVTGTLEEIRQNYAGLFVWDRVATGLILSTPAFSGDVITASNVRLEDGKHILTASVPNGKLDDFFGIPLTGVSGMEIAVTYTDTAVLSLGLTYTAGYASVTVSVAFTY